MTAPTAHTGIQTYYKHTLFRSRTEARWAAFMDLIGWEWTYEPFDGDGYIPDFIIRGPRPLVLEVKGAAASIQDLDDHMLKVERGIEQHWKHDYLIVGSSPLVSGMQHLGPWIDDENPPVGIVGARSGGLFGTDETWTAEGGVWARCLVCRSVGVIQATYWWHLRPCGHYDGSRCVQPVGVARLEAGWRMAGTEVRWTPPSEEARTKTIFERFAAAQQITP